MQKLKINGPSPDHLKQILINKKMFPRPPAPNLLTVVEKETIRYLYAKDPKEWTVESLVEAFPVDYRGVKAILKNRPSKSLKSIQLQDKEVCENWKLLSKGLLELQPEIKENLKIFHRDPKPLNLSSAEQNKILGDLNKRIQEFENPKPKLLVKPGEFGNIILDYERRSEEASEGKNVYSKETKNTQRLLDEKSADKEHTTDEKIDLTNEMSSLFSGEMLKGSPPIGASTPYGETAIMDFNIDFSGDEKMDVERFREIYLNRLNPVLDQSKSKTNLPFLYEESSSRTTSTESKAYSAWLQQQNEKAKMVTKEVTKVDTEEIIRTEALDKIPHKYKDEVQVISDEVQLPEVRVEEDEVTGAQEVYVITKEGEAQALTVQSSPDTIQIPDHLKHRYSLFQFEDSMYDSDGEFLYRIPGLQTK